MSLILNIDTSSSKCSVALSTNEKIIVYEEADSYNHTQVLLPLIKKVFKFSNNSVSDLSAVALNIGPGSYTGLRVGLATAKGLCYSAGIKFIPVSGLFALAGHCINANYKMRGAYVLGLNNYRKGWYYVIYDENLNELSPTDSSNSLPEIISKTKIRPMFVYNIPFNDISIINNLDNIKLMPPITISANHLAAISSYLMHQGNEIDIISAQPHYINSVFLNI